MTKQQLDLVKADRMRFQKNSLSSNLSLLSIVFNAFFFVSVYTINEVEMYESLLGISVVYNLIFMLIAFLSSIKVKAYDFKFAILLICLSLGQIVRIFIYPPRILENLARIEGIEDQHTWLIIFLCLSFASMAAAGIFGILRSLKRSRFVHAVESGEIDLSFLSNQAQEVQNG